MNFVKDKNGIVWCNIGNDEKKIDLVKDLLKELNNHEIINNRNKLFKSFGEISLLYNKTKINIDFFNNFESLFYKDNECLCNLLKHDNKSSNNTFYKGKQLGSGKVGTAYKICFKQQNNEYCLQVLKTMPYESIKFTIGSVSTIPLNYVSNYNKFIFNNDINNKELIYFGSTAFINQTCIHMTINNILNNTNNNYLYQYDAFFCGSQSKINLNCNITDICSLGDLNNYLNLKEIKISNDLLIDIINQLFRTLFILKNIENQFTHSDLKPKNVFVAGTVDKPIYKLADFDKSSIFHNRIRFYNNTIDYEPLFNIVNKNFPYFLKSDDFFFHFELIENERKKINNQDKEYLLVLCNYYLQFITMHNKVPFNKSYDYYTFMIGLLLEKKVNSFFKDYKNKNSLFYQLWRSMWENEQDFNKVNKFIDFSISCTDSILDDEEKEYESVDIGNNIVKKYSYFSEFYEAFLYSFNKNNNSDNESINNKSISESSGESSWFSGIIRNDIPMIILEKITKKITKRKLDITSLDFIKKSLILLECKMYIDLHSNKNFTDILYKNQKEYIEKKDIDYKNIIRLSDSKDDIFKKKTINTPTFKKKQGGSMIGNLTKGFLW